MDHFSGIVGHYHGEIFVWNNPGPCGTRDCPYIDELTIIFCEGVTLRQVKRLIRTVGGKLVKVERMWCSASAAPGREGQLVVTLAPSNKYFDLVELLPRYKDSRLVASIL